MPTLPDNLPLPNGKRISIKRLSPKARATYDRIRKLREEIGPLDFDIVKALRELRNGDLLAYAARPENQPPQSWWDDETDPCEPERGEGDG